MCWKDTDKKLWFKRILCDRNSYRKNIGCFWLEWWWHADASLKRHLPVTLLTENRRRWNPCSVKFPEGDRNQAVKKHLYIHFAVIFAACFAPQIANIGVDSRVRFRRI